MATTSYDIARSLVAKLGGNPNNSGIVRAVAIWLAYESGSTIYGNNPWNMRPTSLPPNTCTNGADGKNFIKFCTLDDGIKTAAFSLNKDDYRGYRAISDAIRRNDPIGFFRALARSKWSSDNYGGGGKLINAFNSGTSYNRTLSFRERSGGTSPGGGAVSTSPGGSSGGSAVNAILSSFGSDFEAVIPKGKVLTDEDVTKLWNYIYKSGITKGALGILSEGEIQNILRTEIGKPWGPESVKRIQDKMLNRANTYTDPITGAVAMLGETIGDAALTFTVVIIGLVFIIGAFVLYRKSGGSE